MDMLYKYTPISTGLYGSDAAINELLATDGFLESQISHSDQEQLKKDTDNEKL